MKQLKKFIGLPRNFTSQLSQVEDCWANKKKELKMPSWFSLKKGAKNTGKTTSSIQVELEELGGLKR